MNQIIISVVGLGGFGTAQWCVQQRKAVVCMVVAAQVPARASSGGRKLRYLYMLRTVVDMRRYWMS